MITTFLESVRRFRDERGYSNGGLAVAAGLHRNTLNRLDDPTWRPRMDTLEKLERFMASPPASATERAPTHSGAAA